MAISIAYAQLRNKMKKKKKTFNENIKKIQIKDLRRKPIYLRKVSKAEKKSAGKKREENAKKNQRKREAKRNKQQEAGPSSLPD